MDKLTKCFVYNGDNDFAIFAPLKLEPDASVVDNYSQSVDYLL